MRSAIVFSTLTLAACCLFQTACSQLRLPALVGDSMILQRDAKVKIWGWAAAKDKINVRFNGKDYKTKANKEGEWSVWLPATKAGGPYSIDISADTRISLKEVLFGDVWFCSGQSNMVHQMNIHDVSYARDIQEANYSQIRQFWIPALSNLQSPQRDIAATVPVNTGWKAAIGENVRPFSAVAYFFARHLYDRYKIPIGIINASVGGTPIEAWTSEYGLKDFPGVIATILKNKDTAYVNQANREALAKTIRKPSQDLGLLEEIKWFDSSYVPKGWRNINVPGYWEDQGLKDLNGVVWYRKELNIPASMAGKPARVFLGRVVDADVLHINGRQVGNTTYQYPQRRYKIPAGILKEGKNVIVVRVSNTNGKGGFVPDKPYCLFSGNDTIDLTGYWLYKVGEVFEPPGTAYSTNAIVAQNQPSALFNAMVAPVVDYTIKGVLWYQGESNAGQPGDYVRLLPALIHDWRQHWKQPGLPFLYVQLPGFMDYNYLPSESNWAILREAQLKTLSVPNTMMAVAIDLGEWNDIHPDNKKDVGTRLAIAARNLVYKDAVVPTGPVYRSSKIEGNRVVISFDHTGTGLATIDGAAPGEFSIAGADKKFVWAKAKIEGDKIIVWHDSISHPAWVRYAWADNPVHANLYNKEGLPASPFRTDD